MASSPARSRFFAARNAIAKRKAANDAARYAVPPAGPFDVRMSFRPGVSIAKRVDGGLMTISDTRMMTISHARIFLADGSEIDGATVVVEPAAYEIAWMHFNLHEEDLIGTMVTTDSGYRLTSCEYVHVPVHMPEAA